MELLPFGLDLWCSASNEEANRGMNSIAITKSED